MEDRQFSVPELKILIDAVQAATFITEKKSAEMVEKIAALGGSHRADILKSNIVHFNTNKHTNEAIYYSVNELEQAAGGAATRYIIYKVVKGDNLTKIANRNNTTVAKIMSVNPELTSANFIVSGLYIYIPQ